MASRHLYRFTTALLTLSLMLQSLPAVAAPPSTGVIRSSGVASSMLEGEEASLPRAATPPVQTPVVQATATLQADAEEQPPDRYPPKPPGGAPTVYLPVISSAGSQDDTRSAAVWAGAISLAPGYNLISIPAQLTNTDPATVVTSIAGRYNKVIAYDGCDPANPWKIYEPGAADNDLTAIDHTMGFWIEMTSPGVLQVSGTVPATTTIPVCAGWNLIGYPRDRTLSVRGALYDIDGKYERLFTYDSAISSDPWLAYEVTAPSYVNDLQQMQFGRGYWLYTTEDVLLTLKGPNAPPEITFDNLGDGVEITSPRPVTGTVNSSTPVEWTLDIRQHPDGEWTQVATGEASSGESIGGTVDPTLLLNGIYAVRLTATDVYGQSDEATVDVLVGGQMKVGIFTLSFVDLSIPVAGIPIQVVRTYDSRNKAQGDFGIGWTLDIRRGAYTNNRKPGDGWTITPDNIWGLPCRSVNEVKYHITEIRFSDVEFYRFKLRVQSLGGSSALCQATASFVQTGGLPGATLEILDGTDVIWQWGKRNLVYYDLTTVFEPRAVRLTTVDGRKFDLTLQDGLARIEDLNGNKLTINENGIIHSSGRSIAFARDAQNRIERIVDPDGIAMGYTYDTRGDLTRYTDRESYVTTFVYTDAHYLADIIDPRGVRAVRTEYDGNGRIISVTDAKGQSVKLTHDIENTQEVVEDRLGHVAIYEYDERGNVVSRKDELGFTTTNTYDDRDNKLTETDPLGQTYTWTYDNRDNVLTYADFAGNVTRYTYDLRNQLTSYTDPEGNVSTREYDSRGNLIRTTDPTGVTIRYTYDGSGNLRTATDALGQITTNDYNAVGDLIKTTDALGHSTRMDYNGTGLMTQRTQTRTLAGSTTETLNTFYEYDRLGNPTNTIDKLGHVFVSSNNELGKPSHSIDPNGTLVVYDYNEDGLIKAMINPDNTVEEYGYDDEGRETSLKDRDKNTTRYEYDASGRRFRTVFPDDTSTTTTYDPVGRVKTVTDERGHVTTFGYPLYTEVITNALGAVTISRFDEIGLPLRSEGRGNLTQFTDANGYTTTYEYDNSTDNQGDGHLIKTVYPDGTMKQYTYDATGNQVAEMDQTGATTRFGYDALGNLTVVTDTLSTRTMYRYDELGNNVSRTDANGHTTRFEYDGMGRLIKRVLPLGQAETFVYDFNGNMTAHTNFNGDTTLFTYNADNRLIKKLSPDGTSVEFSYTPAGLRTRAGGDSYTYDARGRLLTETKANGEVLSYTYDQAGNRTSIATSQYTVTYAYDAVNRLTSVTDTPGHVTTYSYDPVGNLISEKTPDGVTTTYVYDGLNRLTHMEARDAGGALLSSYSYTLGPTGNRMRVVEGHSGRTVNYTYDARYRLITEEIVEPLAVTHTITYTYDAVGNRLARGDSANGLTTYTYDDNDLLVTESGPSGILTYTYDDNGNLVSKSGPGTDVVYTYDTENRLIRVNAGADVVEYVYDADGIRIRSTLNGSDITNFIVDKNQAFAQVIRETDDPGSERARYVHGLDLVALEQPGVGSRYYHYDGQQSTRYLTDASGEIVDTYTYDAFGNMANSTGTTQNRYLYAGEQFDPIHRSYYLRSRYYDPVTGRFMAMDPLDGIKTEPDSIHEYVYARNDPVNLVDPDGQFAFSVAGIVSIITIRGLSTSSFSGSFRDGFASVIRNTTLDMVKVMARQFAHKMHLWQWQNGFETWFGSMTNATPTLTAVDRMIHVEDGWERTWKGTVSDPLFIVDGPKCPPTMFAHVYNDSETKIYLCDLFWTLPLWHSNLEWRSKTSIYIHEMTHKMHNTTDIIWDGVKALSVSRSLELARYRPDLAMINAYNYEYQFVDVTK